MARREADEKNELKIRDNLSDSDITLFYRMPTTKERQEYQNATIKRQKNKIEFNHAAARLTAGLNILTGFSDDSFERKVDGRYVPISCIEGDANYYPAWREWVKVNASDLVMLMAARVFDGSATITTEDEKDESPDEDIEGK